jgi:hypothetical protein
MTHASEVRMAGRISKIWLPYIGRIPEEQKDEFSEKVCSNFLN